MKERGLLVAATLLALVIVTTATAGGFTTGTLVQVSGTSRFSGCTADDLAGQTRPDSTNFPNSEVEPWVDVNPTDSDNLVGAFQQDRWSNGGARGLVARFSTDGGDSWTESVIPGITSCSGGDYQRATDPWVSFGPDGTVHQLALSFNDVAPPFETFDFDHALLASKSEDGGQSWSQPIEVIRDTAPTVFNDKQSITADPNDEDFVYGIWDRLVFPPSERASIVASFNAGAFRGPAWFARSTDGGDSWEPAREIFDPGTIAQTIGNQIVVLPGGDLIDIFNLIKITQGASRTGAFFNVAIIRSEDQGATWEPQARGSGKIRPIVIDRLGTVFIRDPETGDDVRTGDIIPDIAVDPDNGNLYAVWQDARFSGGAFDEIAFSMSTDGGLTWSQAIKVNATPATTPVGNGQAFTPSVHVSEDGTGTVGVTYYDFRNNTIDPTTLPTDYWIVHCHANCSTAASWGADARLTNTSFDMRKAPFAGGFFTGDYEGLTAVGNQFGAFFSATHETDPGSIFYRTAGPDGP
jgi:hypothetical protein